jgi:hypothetical protein
MTAETLTRVRDDGRFTEEEPATIFGAGGGSPVPSYLASCVVAAVSSFFLWRWLMDSPPAPSF